MANRSDYNKSRTNINELLADPFASDVNKSLIENTFNRMLTKDEAIGVIGTIGVRDEAARVNRQIEEDSVHRQGYQLQPLIHTKIATVDYSISSKDMLNNLERIGVDISRLPKWGDTERFNYAPPVDLDKLVNYTDYYWYDQNELLVKPQYVVMKNRCSSATSRLAQKEKEIAGIGNVRIFNVSSTDNKIFISNNVVDAFTPGTTIDIVGSYGIDGTYVIESAEFVNDMTVLTPQPVLPSNQYAGGVITFDTLIRKLTQDKNLECAGTRGWDANAWDDYMPPDERLPNDDSEVRFADKMLLTWIQENSTDVYGAIVEAHPEWITNPPVEPKHLWEWMDQPKPEFIHLWDGIDDNRTALTDWQIENKWIHKLDLPAGVISKALRANAPIIEYLSGMEMNEWSYTAHKWLTRNDPIKEQFKPANREPTLTEYQATDFTDLWAYVGPDELLPINHQVENTNAKLLSTDIPNVESKERLTPYVATKLTKVAGTRRYAAPGEYKTVVGDTLIILSIGQPDTRVTVESVEVIDKTTFITLSADNAQSGDVALREAEKEPYNAVRFAALKPNQTYKADRPLAGQQNVRAYDDGREQFGNFSELIVESDGNIFVQGVVFDQNINTGTIIEVGIDAAAAIDIGRNFWSVRTSDHLDDRQYKLDGSPTVDICAIRYRYHNQTKKLGELKFPLFDIYNPDGTTAFKANEIFTYVTDQTYPVDLNVGLRLKKTADGRTYFFKQLLLDRDNGPLFCYKELGDTTNHTNTLCSIWKTSDKAYYVPRYVNADRYADGDVYYLPSGEQVVAEVPVGSGDWEVPSQLFYNSSHENRIELSSIELREHIMTILRNQEQLPGFVPSPEHGHRLLEKIDYGVGGTIHEHNDSWDLLASTVFASTDSPLDVLDYAASSYEGALNAQEDFMLRDVVDSLLNEDMNFVGNLANNIADVAITKWELNDNNNMLFGDSSAYSNGVGVQSWPATSPIIGMSDVYVPHSVYDKTLNIREIKHHDGHYSKNNITFDEMHSVARQVINHKYIDPITYETRLRGWTPKQAAIGTELYSTYVDIPVNKLRVIDYWLDGSDFRRFEVIEINELAPSTDAPMGSLWLKIPENQLMERVDTLLGWAPLVIDGATIPAGDVTPAWKLVDLSGILNTILLTIETRLYGVTKSYKDTELKFKPEQYILDADDQTLYDALRERAFLEFVVGRQIAYPFASIYQQTNTFTWNYKNVDVNARGIQGDLINIWSPYADGRDVDWSASYQGIYKAIYGTYYPHLEPWVLNGFTGKPSWWDAEYADTTGTRRWTSIMWKNVLANNIPIQYDAPEGFKQVDGAPGENEYIIDSAITKRMKKKYNYVPVNTERVINNPNGTRMYGLDDLFPPYDPRILNFDNHDIVGSSSLGKPIIRLTSAINITDVKAPYVFGDQSPIELEWIKSTQYQYDILKIAFIMQPMRFLHYSWGNTYLDVNQLDVYSTTNKVFAHQDTIFHGDAIDGETYKSRGVNQWYVNQIRRSGYDFKVSNFRELWTSWRGKLTYQFGSFIDTRSFSIRTKEFNLIKEDYNIFSKLSPGYDSVWIDSLNISVANYGRSVIRNGSKVPLEDGKDWVFTVSLPAENSRVIKTHGVRRYEFEVVDATEGVMRIVNGNQPWKTGEVVQVDTTNYLPFPLDQLYTYYVTVLPNNQFKLSRDAGTETTGDFVELMTEGEGIQFIGQKLNEFKVYGGSITDVNWNHFILDQSQVREYASPFTVTGVQSLIDVIDGYASYKRSEGFGFNLSDAKEIDLNSGRIVSWQTEIERTLDKIYTGLGSTNASVRQYGSIFEIKVSPLGTNTLTYTDTKATFKHGEKVFLFTYGQLPSGLSLNTPYYVILIEGTTDFKLASTALNAYEGIEVNVISSGEGKMVIGAFSSEQMLKDNTVEVNPFRYNLWINTPQGILADIFTGGSSYNSNEVLAYDQYGRPLPNGSAMVFRNDKIAHINIRSNMINDVLVNSIEPNQYNLIHLGGLKAYIDGYEHVIMLNDYMTNGQMIYDAYVGMSLPRFDVDFERSKERTMRPNAGGYYLHDNDMIRNIESQVDDMRNYYTVYPDNEKADYVPYARELLGFEGVDYLDQLNVPQKSKFPFWKGMIRRKGSRNAVRSFINSEHFIDAKVDEFWAYKLGEFGDNRQQYKPRIRVLIDDVTNGDVRYTFTVHRTDSRNDATIYEPKYVPIALEDNSRWVDLPTVRKELKGKNLEFDCKLKVLEIDNYKRTADGRNILVLPYKMYDIAVYDNTTGLYTEVQFLQPNDRVVTVVGAIDHKYIVTGYVADNDRLDPINLIDEVTTTSVLKTKLWDPAAGNDYWIPLQYIDYRGLVDPSLAAGEHDWLENKVGYTWLDTNTVGYAPYYDEVLYPDFRTRLEKWGQLAAWSEPKLYEWVASEMDPFTYSTEGDGSPLSVWKAIDADGDYSEIIMPTIHSYVDHNQEFENLKAMNLDLQLTMSVYVNGHLVDNAQDVTILEDMFALPFSDQWTVNESDYVVFEIKPTDEQVEDGVYNVDYNSIEVDGQFYFWVADKTLKGDRHGESVIRIATDLFAPQVPYHIYTKFVSDVVAPKFTGVVLRAIGQYINSDDRYELQFTKFSNLRDDLDAGASPLDLKNIHSEWRMFRQFQQNKIPKELWIKATESLMGYKLKEFNNDVLIPVPSLERVVYDNRFEASTRYGIGDGQSFTDRLIGIKSVIQLISNVDFDTSPVDKKLFLDTYTFDTPLNIKNAMEYMFVNFSSDAVNTIFFELMHDAMTCRRDYPDIMKTSFIALHGVKILEVSGRVTD